MTISEPKTIAVVDAGHGETVGIMYDIAKRKRTMISFPTVRAMTSGETLGLGKELEHTAKWSEFGGIKYNMGFEALLNRKHLSVHEGPNRYGNEFHAHMVAAAIAGAGVKSGPVELSIFCPPKMYHDPIIKQRIEDRFAPGTHLEIKMKGDKAPRIFEITGLTIRVEGLQAGFALISDTNGKLVSNDLMDSLLIADLGMQTADFVEVYGGRYNPSDLDVATFAKAGISDLLLEPMLRDLWHKERSFDELTVTDLDKYVRCMDSNGGWLMIDYAGFNTDTTMTTFATERYNFWRRTYAEQIADRIIDSEFSGLNKYKHALMIGGGFHLASDVFKSLYGNKILDTSKIPNVKDIMPYEWNVEAGIRAALARARKNGWIA